MVQEHETQLGTIQNLFVASPSTPNTSSGIVPINVLTAMNAPPSNNTLLSNVHVGISTTLTPVPPYNPQLFIHQLWLLFLVHKHVTVQKEILEIFTYEAIQLANSKMPELE